MSLDEYGEEKDVVALFTDIRGFSHMFEVLPAHKVYTFTNRYFTTASEIIEKYRGTLDNIVGDGLLAIWGKDSWFSKAPFYAVRSALEMRMALLRQNIQYKWESHFPLEIGVGVAMGKALHCMVGPPRHGIDTVFGTPVILASRLGDIAKNNQIFVSLEVADTISKWAKLKMIPEMEIQGFKNKISYYQVESLMDFSLKSGERRQSSFIRFVTPEIIGMVFVKNGQRKPVILRNLSASGAGIEIVQKEDTVLNEHDEVKLDLKRFNFPNLNILEGKIVQIRTISEESDEERRLSQVGIVFINIDPEKRKVLEHLNLA